MFKIKRSIDIYPITIVEGKNHYVSDDQAEFAVAVGQVVSGSQIHLMLKAFVKEIAEERKLKP